MIFLSPVPESRGPSAPVHHIVWVLGGIFIIGVDRTDAETLRGEPVPYRSSFPIPVLRKPFFVRSVDNHIVRYVEGLSRLRRHVDNLRSVKPRFGILGNEYV